MTRCIFFGYISFSLALFHFATFISIIYVYSFFFLIRSFVRQMCRSFILPLVFREMGKKGTFPARNGLGRMSYRVMWCSSFSIKIEILKHSTGNFLHTQKFSFRFSVDTVKADKRRVIANAPKKNEKRRRSSSGSNSNNKNQKKKKNANKLDYSFVQSIILCAANLRRSLW